MAYQRSYNGVLSNTIEGGKKSKKKLNITGKGTSLSGNPNIALTTSILSQKLKTNHVSSNTWTC
jgi:hypothetical protein